MFPTDGELECRRCQSKEALHESKRILVTDKAEEPQGILVIEEDAQTLPTARVGCPSCGNNKAYWVLRQMRGSDEPETRIYRCTKCSNTWREN